MPHARFSTTVTPDPVHAPVLQRRRPSPVPAREPEPPTLAPAAGAHPAALLRLQRIAGNQAVSRLIQRKLLVGAAHDPAEQEADRAAEQVMSAPAPEKAQRQVDEEEIQTRRNPLQRQMDEEEIQTKRDPIQRQEDEEELQTKSEAGEGAFEPGAGFEDRLAAQQNGGQPLPGSTRDFMENRFGADFGGVRIHTGGGSNQLNREVQARAFTYGSHIYLGDGEYQPDTGPGRQLLAHELAHVVQQGGARPQAVQAKPREPGLDAASPSQPTIQRMQVLEKKKVMKNELIFVGFREGEELPPEGKPHTDGYIYNRKEARDKDFPGFKVYLQNPARTFKKTEEDKIREAWDRKISQLNGNLYATMPASGTFEFVAQEYFPSMETESTKQRVRESVYEVDRSQADYEMRAHVITDYDKMEEILTLILNDSLGSYEEHEEEIGAATKRGALTPEEISILAGEKKVQQPDLYQGELPQAVGLGYHGTNQPMSVVAEKSGEPAMGGQTGWGGLKKTKDLSFKKTAFCLDAPWNPLKAKLRTASFRKGVNWDNELLSTVSVATHPTPAIKFPFPQGSSPQAVTYLFAVIVEKAYPTFKIQKDAFPEVAVDKVDPEDIIGMSIVHKYYDKTHIEDAAEEINVHQKVGEKPSNELFAYMIGDFIPNFRLSRRYPRSVIEALCTLARQKIIEELGPAGTMGIYDSLKIKK